MSTHNSKIIDGVAGAAILKGQFVKYEAGGWVPCDTLGERSHAVAFSDAAAAGDAVAIQVGGLVKYKVGAVATGDGDELTTDANGLGITAVATNIVKLLAKGDGAIGAYAEAYWVDAYAAA